MSGDTSIEWTDSTWNPTTGCTKVGPGCLNCYAETVDRRFHRDGPFVPWTVKAQREARLNASIEENVAGVSWTPSAAITLHPERLDQPLKWKRPRRIFVDSMSDLFHEDVPETFILAVWATMATAPQHTFQVLTKRPERALQILSDQSRGQDHLWRALPGFMAGSPPWPLPNVWLGVSVENQRYAEERIPLLLQTPAAVRFLSCEPLLSPIDLPIDWLWGREATPWCGDGNRQGIDWVIAGGESGPKARPMRVEWAESIVEQCRAAGVPCFVKQDSGPRPGRQGRIPDSLWLKEFPDVGHG